MNGAGAGNMFCSVVPAAAAEHLHDARAVLADAGDEPVLGFMDLAQLRNSNKSQKISKAHTRGWLEDRWNH
jgi:hypothetical protein